MAVKISSLNLNGINTKDSQYQLELFLKKHKIDILLAQEHNLKINFNVQSIDIGYDIYLNASIHQKGGTAIFIRKNSGINVLNVQLHPSSRIICMSIKINDLIFKIINIYGHSGPSLKTDRENLFLQELPFYLQGNLDNIIVGGDFNCITSEKDVSKYHSYIMSSSLKTICNDLKLYDIHNICNKGIPQYTFIKDGYGSRIDKIYVNKLKNSISNFSTVPVSHSDHHAVLFNLTITNINKYKFTYWKFNASITEDKDVYELLNNSWTIFQSKQTHYLDILEWWDKIKIDTAKLFIKVGKLKNAQKYGLLNMLENELKNLNYEHQINPTKGYNEIQTVKAKINAIKDSFYEGVKIRARITDRISGEKISSYLIGKQKRNGDNYISSIKINTNLVTNPNAVILHATDYYEKLYGSPTTRDIYDNILLENFSIVIDGEENILLTAPITETEILNALRKMSLNKSPGEDGLTVEFYRCYWNIIKQDLTKVMNYMLIACKLSKSQSSGIVTLFHKNGDKSILKNWRPITLLCVDYKIFTKILVARIRPLLKKFISEEQFCGIPGKSIINCNILLRDVLFYAIENDLELALVNLDFQQAFDKVDVNFIFKTMKAVGFSDHFIACIKMLYSNITSRLKINNNLGKSFQVLKGVRQGCPLSMILFIIYQEALYRMIKKTPRIKPLYLPNDQKLKMLGYADDSNVFISREADLNVLYNIINKFSIATGAQINMQKTKIMGFGKWKTKTTWSGNWLVPENTSLQCLGICYYKDWETTAKENWKLIESKVEKHINCLTSRQLTIFQKSLYINCCILSKMIYISHIIPVDKTIAKKISKLVFNYVWNGNYDPIKRDYLYLPKDEGGIGIMNIINKCNSTLVKSFMKKYIDNDNQFKLMWFYCDSRLSSVMPKSIQDVCYNIPSYYNYTIDICRSLMNHKKFPNIVGKEIYKALLSKVSPEIETKYPLYNWKKIWQNIHSKYVEKYDRMVCYKFIYNILPTKRRLMIMNVPEYDSDLCNVCNEPETNFHLLYFCRKVNELYKLILRLCEGICKMKVIDPFAFLYFDFKVSGILQHVCSVIISSYISFVWSCRNEDSGQRLLQRKLRNKIKYNVQTILLCPNLSNELREKFEDVDGRCENLVYSNMIT